MNGAVTFHDAVWREARFLKLPVHVGGEDKVGAGFLRGGLEQQLKSDVRNSAAIKIQTVTVKRPGQRGVGFEPIGIGHLRKREAKFRDGWIRFPETFSAAKVRQPGIDANARASSDQKCIGALNRQSGAFEDGLEDLRGHAVGRTARYGAGLISSLARVTTGGKQFRDLTAQHIHSKRFSEHRVGVFGAVGTNQLFDVGGHHQNRQ